MSQHGIGMVFMIVGLAAAIVVIASTWKVFTKAGQPGWASIVPIYNYYVMLKIGNNPGWYLLLMLVPLVNIFIMAKMFIDVAKAFGQGIGTGIGLWLLPIVFFPLLGFGDYAYVGVPDGGRGGGGSGEAAV